MQALWVVLLGLKRTEYRMGTWQDFTYKFIVKGQFEQFNSKSKRTNLGKFLRHRRFRGFRVAAQNETKCF